MLVSKHKMISVGCSPTETGPLRFVVNLSLLFYMSPNHIHMILTNCWWKKSCTTWDVQNHVNSEINKINYHINWLAGYQPSTVSTDGARFVVFFHGSVRLMFFLMSPRVPGWSQVGYQKNKLIKRTIFPPTFHYSDKKTTNQPTNRNQNNQQPPPPPQ